MAFSIISEPYRKDKNGEKFLKAVCQCGKEFELKWFYREIRKSCGCLKYAGNRKSHGHCKTKDKKEDKTYVSWRAMRSRCLNENDTLYHRYGGRGIEICERWHDYSNFLADMGHKPEGYTIERIDTDRGYEPENCKWATRSEQSRNKSSNRVIEIDGVRKCVAEWCELTGVSQSNVNARLNRLGWTEKEAIFGKPKD